MAPNNTSRPVQIRFERMSSESAQQEAVLGALRVCDHEIHHGQNVGRLRKLSGRSFDVWYARRHKWIVVLDRKDDANRLHVYPDARIAAHQLGMAD